MGLIGNIIIGLLTGFSIGIVLGYLFMKWEKVMIPITVFILLVCSIIILLDAPEAVLLFETNWVFHVSVWVGSLGGNFVGFELGKIE